MKFIENTTRWLSKALLTASCLLALVLMIVIVSDVLRRNLTGHGFQGAVEYTEVLLVGIVFLAWAGAQRAGTHVSIDLLYMRLKPLTQRLMLAFGLLLVVIFLVPLTVMSFESGVRSFMTGEFRIGIASTPVWPARFAVAIGMISVVLECFSQLLAVFGEIFTGRSRQQAEAETQLLV